LDLEHFLAGCRREIVLDIFPRIALAGGQELVSNQHTPRFIGVTQVLYQGVNLGHEQSPGACLAA
jgi:hypothetical protein